MLQSRRKKITRGDLANAVGRFDRVGPAAGQPMATVRAIARMACDHKLTLEERVKWVMVEIDHQEETLRLCDEANREFVKAQEASKVTLRCMGRVVTVVSTHQFATNVGYAFASVVIAQNPAMLVDFRDPTKGTYNKFTVCRYDSHVKCDLPAALMELQALEPGWGGRSDIFGSPQGVSSMLTLDQVVEGVSRHLKPLE